MHDLSRFLEAQRDTYATALGEIIAGKKVSHWMWYIFPQLVGLGRSPTAVFYGIRGAGEARAFLDDPTLGPRLVAISSALLKHSGISARAILGTPDDLKLRSSMTLFMNVADAGPVFSHVIDQYFDGKPDQRTIALLKSA